MEIIKISMSILLLANLIAIAYVIKRFCGNLKNLRIELDKRGIKKERRKYNGEATIKIMLWIMVSLFCGNILGLFALLNIFRSAYAWPVPILLMSYALANMLFLFYKQAKLEGKNDK